ncbi:Murein DD-endopeptidase MepM and murein hydrolase activator NlpD, contain LysM domain [Streptomyces sp. TverLS-915]|uniref:M23 family metallopeptidase n=1 Tax=Streptomyces sp. TverLS-915 TaxID=1839763 RepID=UPI00081F33F4|nr:M23 family metallopeptidase [Streptomyces sp. TverLS-915]SCD95054.1 Murein DD-endopeptidase MepM and murein hydrolase activator NlpD, contain LysM domain [Streptomyces sp. TverLS-915]
MLVNDRHPSGTSSPASPAGSAPTVYAEYPGHETDGSGHGGQYGWGAQAAQDPYPSYQDTGGYAAQPQPAPAYGGYPQDGGTDAGTDGAGFAAYGGYDPYATGSYDTSAYAPGAFAPGAHDSGQWQFPADTSAYTADPYAVPQPPAYDYGYPAYEGGHAYPAETYANTSWNTGGYDNGPLPHLPGAMPAQGGASEGLGHSGADTGTYDASAWAAAAPGHPDLSTPPHGTPLPTPPGTGAREHTPGPAADASGEDTGGLPVSDTGGLPVSDTGELPVVGADAPPYVPGEQPEAARGRGRRRPAKRSALLSIAVPSACVMGVAGVAAASVGDFGGDSANANTASAPSSPVKAAAANNKLDTQLADLSRAADDVADRASRTQERIDLKAKKEAQHKAALAEAARKERERPKFVLPVTQHGLSAYFGQAGVNWMSQHTGIDFPVAYGTPVMAATDGTVRSQWNSAYGNMAILTAKDGTETWYCHLSSTTLPSGTAVKAGQVIAHSGNSGNSTGPHMHFEVRPGGGAAIDPLPWLRSHGLDPA